MNETGFIYAVTEDGLRHKIGFTVDLRRRLATLQTAQPRPLAPTAALAAPTCRLRALEAQIHREIAWRRCRGEWYRLDAAEAADLLAFAGIRWLEDASLGPPPPAGWTEVDPCALLGVPRLPAKVSDLQACAEAGHGVPWAIPTARDEPAVH